MRLKKLTASFGRLNHASLELGEGLNLIQAPNEAGKSTWSAFLRAMLYGINTKERDRQGFIAEKNRYLPWSGAPMEGAVTLSWQGRDLILRRSQKGNTPFGKFEAVYADTDETVPGLTGENAGETLLGVPREVFERSAFVGQGCAAVDGAPALEKRVSALVSSGEEEVSYSQVERRLRDWLNRRQHNKTGLIPKLEHELTVLEDTLARQSHAHRLAEEAKRDIDLLNTEKSLLEAETAVHRYLFTEERRKTYEQATSALEAAEAEVAALRAELNKNGVPPDRESLRKAQEDLNYLNTLNANIKLAEAQRDAAAQAANAARDAAEDPLFSGLTPDAAWQRATEDAEAAPGRPGLRIARILLASVCLAAGVGGLFLGGIHPLLPIAGGAAILLGAALFVLGLIRGRGRKNILARYGVEEPNGILSCAAGYRERYGTAAEADRQAQAVEDAFVQMTAQRDESKRVLLDLVHTFAPMVSDVFGVSAAISRALSLEERLSTAQVRLEGARRLALTVPKPEGESVEPPQQLSPRFPYQETSARLAAVKGELNRLSSALAMAQGELNSLGDPVLFQARKDTLLEELQQRRAEYTALELALEGLGRANSDLQARFSPALNQRAGVIMAALTGGKYDRITLTRDFEASAGEAGDILPRRVLTLSQGTADQLYLAVRLAVCELALPVADDAPLVLDDALANFDDARMALALDYLHELAGKRQILLFTCHAREGAYLEGRENVTRVRLQTD